MTDLGIMRQPIGRPHRTRLQQNSEAVLAKHPYVVEVRGSLDSLSWPAICAYCGGVASERLAVPKVFLRPRPTGYGPRGFAIAVVTTARIPFCAACAVHHERLVLRPTLARKILRALFTPMLIPVIGAIFVLGILLPTALETPIDAPGAAIPWGLVALMVFTLAWSLVAAWRVTLRDRIEKQTEITLAGDFSGDVSGLFEGERHIYSMRNATFAAAFAEANHDRLWTADDDARSEKRQTAVFVVGLAVAMGVWLWVVLMP